MDEDKEASQVLDAVLITLGWPGRFQILQLLMLFLCLFPAAFNMMAIVFIGKMNEHKCKEAINDTSHIISPDVTNVTYGTCSVTSVNFTGEKTETPCPDGLVFADPRDHSVVSEWGLVCEKEALTDVSQTVMTVGMMVGAVVFTSLADRYGRKPLHIVNGLGVLLTGLATAFAPSFVVFISLRFFLGAFEQGFDLTGVILGMEILPARCRYIHMVFYNILWGCAMVLLGLLSFLMRHLPWRYLQLIISGFSAYTFLLICFLEESVRWLVANGRVEHAERILKKAAAQNKVSQVDVLNVFRTKVLRQHTSDEGHDLKNGASEVPGENPNSLLGSHSASGDKEDLPKYGITDFFRHKHVFICTVINGFAWFVNVLTYYGLSMTSVNLADDMYLGFTLSALVELPTAPVAFYLVERCNGDRDTRASTIAVVVLSLVGKFAITASFGTLFMYTPEQFPTNLRNASLGVASMAGRVGGTVAPYSRTLIRHFPWAPGTIFGVCCLLLPVCMRMLPETCGRELPQTIEDMELYITAPDKVSPRSQNEKQKSEITSV
ncbi:solute carrier family 22 member 15-like [Babylonia areolata]|uniref:solute carrier family 22 member 15-like n=1 Tax=Babylonia areolata TaxID=304850 RepID=UPI003FD3007B